MNELYHYGVKGMKWGVRRYQDKNGRLTSEGRARYIADKTKGIQKDIDSYSPYLKTGIKARDGKLVMTSKDVKDIVNGLEIAKNKIAAKYGEKYDKVAKKMFNNKIKDINSATLNHGKTFVTQHLLNQQFLNQRFTDWSMQESTRASINAANQALSLSISGGTNPFMFGMI